jgi:surface protein
MSRLFKFGFNQKIFGGNHKLIAPSVNMGNTKGKGSTTRRFNYCTQHSAEPSSCINQFITINSVISLPIPINDFIYSFDFTGYPEPILTINNLPIINNNNSFILLKFNTTVNVINIMTVTITYQYLDNGSDDGLCFNNVLPFYNQFTNLTILNFGDIPLSRNYGGYQASQVNINNSYGVFSRLNNIIFNTSTIPRILSNTYMTSLFQNCIFNSDISSWNTINVINMDLCFVTFNNDSIFNNGDTPNTSNNPLNWNTVNVTSMFGLFGYCNFFNQDITTWNTSNVTRMRSMFFNCANFNQPIGNWQTGKLTDIQGTLQGCEIFNQPLNWDTSNVITMEGFLFNCNNFNQPINFNTSNVTNMSSMFGICYNLNQPINFNTSNVTNMSSMFESCNNFNQPINFNTSNVTNMSNMFSNCYNFNQPINFNTSNVTNMSSMFENCNNFNQPINFNTSNVTNMFRMFVSCSKLNQTVTSNETNNYWVTSNVTNMTSMFEGCTLFNNGWNAGDNTHPMNWITTNVPSAINFGNNSPLKFYPIPGTSNNNMFDTW